jgi:hypothetical protein
VPLRALYKTLGLIKALQAVCATSLQAIAAAVNDRGIPTARSDAGRVGVGVAGPKPSWRASRLQTNARSL